MLHYGYDPSKLPPDAAAVRNRLEREGIPQACGYSLDAIFFVLVVLCHATGDRGQFAEADLLKPRKRAISARKLCDLLCEEAQRLYGERAYDCLLTLRLRRGEDVSEVIAALVEGGFARTSEGDRMEEFVGINLLRDVQRP